jgi:ABC-2 type transport system ATP-binding protein
MPVPDRSATRTSDTVVELAGVWKVYAQRQRGERLRDVWRALLRPRLRRVEALRGIDLVVRRGEIVAYAGPNGAGKSTTIKLLAGLLAPDAGAVRVLGLDPVRQRVPYVGRIGVVFGQRTELWWDQPVAASFEWKRVVWDIPRPTYERMLGFLTEVLGLGEFRHTLARELSLGQKMRADLAMALLHEPEVLLLDEPTLGLDVLAKRNILGFVKELNRRRRTTVVVTSHDMADLEELAGRIVMVHHGQLAFDGPFDALRRTFADRRRLLIQTAGGEPPALAGADLVASAGGRHEYVFDAARVRIADLLAQVGQGGPGGAGEVLDVETHRLPIDEVVADIYERWLGAGHQVGGQLAVVSGQAPLGAPARAASDWRLTTGD